jgi:hypothetical protein
MKNLSYIHWKRFAGALCVLCLLFYATVPLACCFVRNSKQESLAFSSRESATAWPSASIFADPLPDRPVVDGVSPLLIFVLLHSKKLVFASTGNILWTDALISFRGAPSRKAFPRGTVSRSGNYRDGAKSVYELNTIHSGPSPPVAQVTA